MPLPSQDHCTWGKCWQYVLPLSKGEFQEGLAIGQPPGNPHVGLLRDPFQENTAGPAPGKITVFSQADIY